MVIDQQQGGGGAPPMFFREAADDWDISGMGGDKSSYADWTGILRDVLYYRLLTLDDIFGSAVLIHDDQRRLLVQLLDLANLQFHAYCNNRLALLEALNSEIDILSHYGDGNSSAAPERLESFVKATVLFISTLPQDERNAAIAQNIEIRRREIRQIKLSIDEDKRGGHFQDYTDVKIEIAGGTSPTDVLERLPEFYRIAHNYAKSTESDTRLDHQEAIVARLVRRLGLDASSQRRVQSGGRRRRRGGDGGIDNYTSGEDGF